MDSDDWLKEGCLEMLYKKAKETGAEMVMGNTLFYYNDNRIERRYNIPDEIKNTVFTGKECFMKLMSSFSYIPMIYNYLYKRSWLESVGMKFEDVVYEDELWTLFSMCQASGIIITDLDFYFYRQREGSIMHGGISQEKKTLSLFRIADHFLDFSDNYSFENEPDLKSWIYVKIHEVFFYAFNLLSTLKEGIVLPENRFGKLENVYSSLVPQLAYNLCLHYQSKIRKVIGSNPKIIEKFKN